MSNLRQMIDGVGSLELDVAPVETNHKFRLQDQAVYRRPIGFTKQNEVLIGTILAFRNNGNTAEISVKRSNGTSQRIKNVPINKLAPVTEALRRSSIQFSPAGGYRGRV